MNPLHIDLLFQYALAVAAQADDYLDRSLGPIHLLKYAYLGDAAYAKKHEGVAFSGTQWRFHHFGPWSVEAWRRLPEALATIGAQKREYSSQYREDNIRWSLKTAVDPDSLVSGVPVDAALAIGSAVREFGSDTVGLLHYVYRSPPMLGAAPGEVLIFPAQQGESEEVTDEASPVPPLPVLSRTKLRRLKNLVKVGLGQRRGPRRVEPDPLPRYDEVFAKGAAWLDRLAGEPVRPEKGVLSISDQVWKSRARGESELP